MRKGLLLIIAVFTAFVSFSQTTLISPTGDGGFENGSTLAANGWTGVSSVQSFFVGSATAASAGSNCAYTSTTSGSWTPGTSVSIAHIYKDITIPAGESSITVSLKYKTLAVDAGYDYLKVHIVSTATTPVGGTALATGQLGANTDGTTSYAIYTFSGTVTAGTTQRLVISFRQDGVNPYGAAAIDEISVTSKAPVTYTWNATSGSASWATGTSWTPTRTTPDVSDILQFTNGGSSTVTSIPTQTVGQVFFGNNTTAYFQAAATSTLTMGKLTIPSGSALYSNGTTAALTMAFSTGAVNPIDGRLEISNTGTPANAINFTNSVTTIGTTATLAAGGTLTTSPWTSSSTTLVVNGTYEHKYTTVAGTIPTATWGASSNTNIIGYTSNTNATSGFAQNFANFTWNCTSQTGAINLSSSSTTGVSGTFTITSTGSGSLRWTGTGPYTVNANNFTQTGGTFDLANGAIGSSMVFNVSGTFNQTAGTFSSGGTSTNSPTLNFNGSSAQSVTFAAQPTGPITYRFSNAAGVTLNGSWGANFTVGNGTLGGVRISTTATNPITFGGTLTGFSYNAANSTLTYDATGSYTARAQEFPATGGPANLAVAVGAGNVLTVPFSRSLSCTTANSVLTMTSGDLDLGSNNLTLGYSATYPGTLNWTAGSIRVTTGTLKRWYPTSGLPNGSPSTSIGYYPLAFGTNNRNVQIYFSAATALSAGGTITVGHYNAIGTSPVSVADGAYTIQQQTNAYWPITAADGITASGTLSAKITGGGLVATTGTNLRLMQNGAISGTFVASTGTAPNFAVSRTGLSIANINQNQYIGAANADLSFLSIATGNWEDGSTWNKGTAPTASDVVTIASGNTVTVNAVAANASALTINSGATLNVNGNSLTIATTLTNSGTTNANAGTINVTAASTTGITNSAGATFLVNGGTVNLGVTDNTACNRTFSNSGTLTVQSGSLNIYGNYTSVSGSTLNQSGGNIKVDGNAGGVTANSVASATDIVYIYAAAVANLNLTGGVFTIVDPHPNTSTSVYSLKVYQYGAANQASSNHTFKFGDGVSTDAGGNASYGFDFYLYPGSYYYGLGSVVVDAASGTNRYVYTYSTTPILGNLTINSGEFRIASTTYLKGNLVNNGTLTTTSTLSLSDFANATYIASTNAQTISGSGTFRNATSSPTASLTSLTVNNSNATGVTLNVPLSVSGTLTMTSGLINTTATNLLTLGSTATISGTPSATNMVVGPFARTFAASRTASGTYTTSATLFPVGKGTSYLPVFVDPTTTSGGTVTFTGEAFTSNSGSGAGGVSNLSTNRWEVLASTGKANLTGAYLRLADNAVTATSSILQAISAADVYGSILPASVAAIGTPGTVTTSGSQILNADWNGYFAYGDLTPCSAPYDQPSSLITSLLTTTSFTGTFTAASSAPSHYLIVRYPSGGTPTNPVDNTVYAVGGTLGTGTIAYNGVSTTFTQSGLTAGTTYDYYFYSYNNSGCFGPVFNTASPYMSSVTTCASATGAPGTPTSSALSATGFTITWTASSTAGADYELDISTNSGFTTYESGYQAKFIPSGTLSEVVSGLSVATTYYVRVRAVRGGCYSANSSSLTVTTLCNAISTFPYTEGFNTAGSLPSCWLASEGSTGATYHWESVATDASHGAASPAEGAAFLRMNYYNASTSYNAYYLTSIPFSLNTVPKRAKFSIWMGSASGSNNLLFQVSTNGGSSWTTLATYTQNPANSLATASWDNQTVDLTTYASQTVIFRLNATSNFGSNFCNIAFDNFQIEDLPACVNPTSVSVSSITNNSASVSFSGSGSAFIVEYGATGFTPGTGASAGTGGTIVTGSSSPIALSGLSAATAYDVYVRQDCSGSGNGYSANSSKVSFTTLCNATSVPYTQDFESVTTPALPSCSAFENAGLGNNWTTTSPAGYGFTSKTLTYSYNYSNAANAWFYTQGLNLTGGVAYVISYKYGNNSSSYTEKLKVAYGTSATYSAMTSVLADHASITGGSASTNSVVFTPSISGTYYFGFNAYSAANQDKLYVDDISINVAPWTWTGTTSTDWAVASNWDLGSVPNSSTNSVVIPNVTNKPIISSGTYSIKDATIATSSSLAINGTLQVFGNITNNATVTGSGTLTLNGSTAQTVTNTSSTNSITVSTFTLNNNTGATLSGSGFVNVTGTVNVTAGILASAGRLTLKSTATTNARVGSVAAGAISGSVNVERYFPGKRAFRFLGHPFNSSIALGQLMATNGANTGIDVTGAGGSTNGFTTTGSNNPSAFNYTPASGNSATNPDPGWNAIGSASATNWASKQGLRVFVRGTKGEGLNGLAYTPSATTVTMSGTLNDGSSPVFSLSNGASSDYNLIANPLASTIDVQALTLGGDVAGSSFYVWDVSQGAAGAYVNEPFASAATYRYLPLGSAFFARSASGAGTITFPEAAKVSNTPAAILRGTSKYGNNSIQLVLDDNTGVKHDRILFFFSKRAAEEKDNMDGEKMTNPGVNFYANSKDSKKLSIDVRPLTDNTIIPLTLNTPFDREFTITAEDFNVTDNKDLLLHDKKTDTYTKLSAGVSYSFTSTLSDATTYGNRFELITKVNPSLLVENILDIKLSPNPVKDVLTINYSTPNATLEATTIIKITNNVGQIIENLNLGASATGSQKINMSKYAKGVYTIELVVGKEKVVKQIVKQ